MNELGKIELEQALTAVGELLAAEGERIGIVVVGGASLNLLGIVQRSTSDVDVIARAYQGPEGEWHISTSDWSGERHSSR